MKRPDPPIPQLILPFARDAAALAEELAQRAGKRIVLVLTDNAASLLSVRYTKEQAVVRLQRMFLDAGDAVLDEIAAFINRKKIGMAAFRRHFRERRNCVAKKPPRRVAVRTAGEYHDLRALFNEINRDYFEGRVDAVITWGAASGKQRVRSRTLGSYSPRTHVIRINPVLDRRNVPRYFVSYVVYHEMLHADLGIGEAEGRRSVHGREFRKRERLFSDYERALTWERTR